MQKYMYMYEHLVELRAIRAFDANPLTAALDANRPLFLSLSFTAVVKERASLFFSRLLNSKN